MDVIAAPDCTPKTLQGRAWHRMEPGGRARPLELRTLRIYPCSYPAVDGDDLTGDVPSFVGGEPERRERDVFRFSEPAHRDPTQHGVYHLLRVGEVVVCRQPERRVYLAWGDAVHPDLVFRVIEGHRPG